MSIPNKELHDMLRIRQYLQEAQDWAREADFTLDPTTTDFDAASAAAPASVVPLIDASAEQADAVISSLSRRLENPDAD